MAKSVAAVDIEINSGKAITSMGDLKKALKEANFAVIEMREKFGETSQEAINAAQRAAELKDRIGDAKDMTDAFNPDAKFNAFSGAIQGVVGGFSALQGALGLFGAKSEEVEKTLLKVQSAMALSEGLNTVMKSVDSFKTLGAMMMKIPAIQKIVTAGQYLWNLAMSMNPIGLLIAGVTALIGLGAALFSWFSSSSKKNEENKKAVEANTVALEKQEKQLERNGLAFERNQTHQLNMAKASGANAEAIRKLELKLADEKVAFAESQRAIALNTKAKMENALASLKAEDASDDLIDKQKKLVDQAVEQYNKENKNLQNAFDDRNELRNRHQEQILQEQTNANNAAAEKRKKDNEDAIAKAKQRQQEIENANKQFTAEAKKIAEENFLASIKDDNERAKEKLRIDMLNKQEEIKNSVASEKQKSALLKQVSIKYWADVKDIDEKAAEEKIKRESENEKATFDLINQIRIENIRNAYVKAQESEAQRFQDEIDKQLEFLNKKEISQDEYNKRIEALTLQHNQNLNLLKEEQTLKEAEKDLQKANNQKISFEERLKAIADREALESQLIFNTQEERTKFEKENADARKAIAKDEADYKVANLQIVGDAIGTLGQVIGKDTAAGKALAIAQATINTYLGASNILAPKFLSGPLAPPIPVQYIQRIAAVAGILATGFKTVKGIIATKVPGSSGGSGGGSSPNVSASAPVGAQLSSTALNQQMINQMSAATTRAFVLESDVSGNQERITRLNRAARIN